MATSLEIGMWNVERATWIGLIAGGIILFLAASAVICLTSRLRAQTGLHLLASLLLIPGLAISYLLYGHIASAVQEALILRFVETGFICLLPGNTARLFVPSIIIGGAFLFQLRVHRRRPAP
jgi:hypothetical protein